MKGKKINIRKKRLAFKTRCRMLQFKNNFGSKSVCQICKEINSEDDQIHGILKCDKIKQLIQTPLNVVYEDIFGENCDKIDQFLSGITCA